MQELLPVLQIPESDNFWRHCKTEDDYRLWTLRPWMCFLSGCHF